MTDPLLEKLKQTLLERELTVAVAESLTGGNLAALLTSVSGSSGYFMGGVVAYTIHSKVELLGVDGQHAAEVNCVSAQVAAQMAEGVRSLFGSDIGIATTGYAERFQLDGKWVGPKAYVAVSIPDRDTWTGLVRGTTLSSRRDMQNSPGRSAIQALLNMLGSPVSNSG